MATERPSTMEEYPRPLAQVWTRLATRGRDTLLVVNPASGNDLTGNVTFAVGAYQGLVVPNEGDVSLPTSELELPGGRPLVVDRGQAASAAGEDRLQTIRKRLERCGRRPAGGWLTHPPAAKPSGPSRASPFTVEGRRPAAATASRIPA